MKQLKATVIFGWLSGLLLCVSSSLPVRAQDEAELELDIRRDFGFQGGDRIQGTFSMQVEDTENLVEVSFLIDGQVVNTDREPPFRYQFSTGAFALGEHTLAAVGTTQDGRSLSSAVRTLQFVSADESWQAALSIAGPILGLVLAGLIVGALLPALLDRGGRRFRVGVYGAAGGAVCPRCTLPYPRHVLAPNLIVGKLERCPHCGRWAVARPATRAELEAAEGRWRSDRDRGTLQVEDEQERLRREIDESRYES